MLGPAVLPAPYCLLLSNSRAADREVFSYYALTVTTADMAWAWPAAPLADGAQWLAQLSPSARPDRLYALVWYQLNSDYSVNARLAALHSGNGTAIWEYELRGLNPEADQPSFAILQPPVLQPAQGERLVFLASNGYQADATAVALNGSTGRLLSTFNVSHVIMQSAQTVGDGSEGYFTIQNNTNQHSQLFRLLPDGSVNQTMPNATALDHAVLHSQPALLYEGIGNQTRLVARDVGDNTTWWSSDDAFLLGLRWKSNATFAVYRTYFHLLDGMADVFLVLSIARTGDVQHNTTVMAQAGLYALSSGKQVALSPSITFLQLNHTDSGVSTQQLGDTFVLRDATAWYALSLPQLTLVRQGLFETFGEDTPLDNWLVDADGSYVALVDGGAQVFGHPPNVTNGGASTSRQTAEAVQRRHVRSE